MWVKIKYKERHEIINCLCVIKICVIEDSLFINYHHKEFSRFIFDSNAEAQTWFEGLELALNGMDFLIENREGKIAGYIKPLFHSKNESLRRHLMLKEILNDNK